MINAIQNFNITNNVRLKNTTEKYQANPSFSFKGGFTRLENGIFRTGGISVWDKKAQHMITKSLSKKQLENLMKSFEETENNRILFCDIYSCGIFKNRLAAHFQCTRFLNNFKENFEQKFFESKLQFLIRILNQFKEYKSRLQ